jgi:hypothetical protein
MNNDELERLQTFSTHVLSNPSKVKKIGKIARGIGNLFNGYAPPPPSYELEEAFSFIEDFIRLNPSQFLNPLDDDELLTIAEVMRIVSEDEREASGFAPYVLAAESMRKAALDLRKTIGYESEEDEPDED